MKQIAFLSGKGGAGKTSFCSAMFSMIDDSVIADCDVECPDISCLIKNKIYCEKEIENNSIGAKISEDCICCGKCMKVCRFNAIKYLKENNKTEVIDYFCVGCEMCSYVCPVDCIYFLKKENHKLFLADSDYGKMILAEIDSGDKGTGRMISIIRKYAEESAIRNNCGYVLIDGAPGIGCPVIASLINTDMVIIITEPSAAAFSDLKRLVELLKTFNSKNGIVINKCDMNEEICGQIEEFAASEQIKIIEKFKFIQGFSYYLNCGKLLSEIPDNELKNKLNAVKKFIINSGE